MSVYFDTQVFILSKVAVYYLKNHDEMIFPNLFRYLLFYFRGYLRSGEGAGTGHSVKGHPIKDNNMART